MLLTITTWDRDVSQWWLQPYNPEVDIFSTILMQSLTLLMPTYTMHKHPSYRMATYELPTHIPIKEYHVHHICSLLYKKQCYTTITTWNKYYKICDTNLTLFYKKLLLNKNVGP